MEFSGTLANVLNALNGLQFIPAADFSGTARFYIFVNDNGQTGIDPSGAAIGVGRVNDITPSAGGSEEGQATVDIVYTDVNDAPTFSINGLPTSTNSTSLAFLETAGSQTVNLANFFTNISVGSPFEPAAGQQISRVSFVVSDPSGIFTGTGGAAPTTNLFSKRIAVGNGDASSGNFTLSFTGSVVNTVAAKTRPRPSPLTPRPRPFSGAAKHTRHRRGERFGISQWNDLHHYVPGDVVGDRHEPVDGSEWHQRHGGRRNHGAGRWSRWQLATERHRVTELRHWRREERHGDDYGLPARQRRHAQRRRRYDAVKTISIIVAPVNQAASFTSIPGVVTPGVGQSEIQTVTINGGPSGGTFTLSYTGTVVNPIPAQTTRALQFNDSAANVLAALQALPALSGNVTSVSLSGTTYTITFGNALTNQDVRQITANASLSGGNNPSIAVATTIGGGDFAIVAAEDLPVSLNSTTTLSLPTATPITNGSSNARIQITDPDALATDLVQVTLSVVKGTITIPTSGVNNGIGSGTIPAGESVVGNGTANVTITSTISRINTTLASANGLVYQAVANYNNTRLNSSDFSPPPPALPVPLPPGDRLTATVNDLGHSGGTPQTSTQTFDISITKINDAPTVKAPIPSQTLNEQGTGSTVSINPGFAPYGSTFFDDVDFGDTTSPDFLALSVVGNTIPANVSATVDAGGFITLTGQGESAVPVIGTVTILRHRLGRSVRRTVVYRDRESGQRRADDYAQRPDS